MLVRGPGGGRILCFDGLGRVYLVMRSQCVRHVIVALVAVLAWLVVVWMCDNPPGPSDAARLPYFAVLGVAVGASSLAVFPWVMRGFIRDQTLAYVAGYMHREADEGKANRPRLEVVR